MTRKTEICNESESEYFTETSKMLRLCPDCSHYLYGHPNCEHNFDSKRCTLCYWNGKTSDYIKSIKV